MPAQLRNRPEQRSVVTGECARGAPPGAPRLFLLYPRYVLVRLTPRVAAVSDALALITFVTIGLLSHEHGLRGTGYARDALPFLGCWFAAALALRLYVRPSFGRLAATWAVGIPTAVLVRALALGRTLGGKELAFLVVSLVTVAVLVTAFRFVLTLLASRAHPARS
jgi:Protein of unknown function (DUF3054)